MAFTLYSLLQASLLIVNAVAVLHEERFLRQGEPGGPPGLRGWTRWPRPRRRSLPVGTAAHGGVLWESGWVWALGMNSQPLSSYLCLSFFVFLFFPIIVLFSCSFLTVSRPCVPRLGVFGVVQRFPFSCRAWFLMRWRLSVCGIPRAGHPCPSKEAKSLQNRENPSTKICKAVEKKLVNDPRFPSSFV